MVASRWRRARHAARRSGRPPRTGRTSPAAGPAWSMLHRTGRSPGHNITAMMASATAIETSGLDAQLGAARGPCRRSSASSSALERRPAPPTIGRLGPDVVAGRLDAPRPAPPDRRRRVDADGRPFGGQVDAGVDHTVGLAQEALDAVDARGARHALDGQDHLDASARRSVGRRWARWSYSPGVYQPPYSAACSRRSTQGPWSPSWPPKRAPGGRFTSWPPRTAWRRSSGTGRQRPWAGASGSDSAAVSARRRGQRGSGSRA